jgi:hypothetical protein
VEGKPYATSLPNERKAEMKITNFILKKGVDFKNEGV